jgi:hypothetical protein
MISGRRSQFELRCSQRGYTLDEVRACIVSEIGDQITVDESHPAYPHAPKSAGSAIPAGGAGTHLKAFFKKWFGQVASPNCSCNAVAAQMDRLGPQWCRDNMEWILGEIQKNAEKRGLPYIRAVVEPIVMLAIRKAERDQKAGQ